MLQRRRARVQVGVTVKETALSRGQRRSHSVSAPRFSAIKLDQTEIQWRQRLNFTVPSCIRSATGAVDQASKRGLPEVFHVSPVAIDRVDLRVGRSCQRSIRSVLTASKRRHNDMACYTSLPTPSKSKQSAFHFSITYFVTNSMYKCSFQTSTVLDSRKSARLAEPVRITTRAQRILHISELHTFGEYEVQ